MLEKLKIIVPKILLAILAGLVAYIVAENSAPYSSYANGLLLIIASGLLFYSFDKWVLHGFDTFTEIKNGNIAAALLVLAYAIIAGAALISAFK